MTDNVSIVPKISSTNSAPLVSIQRTWLRYGSAVGLIAIAHVLSIFCWPVLGPATHTIFLAAVVMASLAGGYKPGLLATALAAADLIFTFIPPYYSFRIDLDEFVFVVSFVGVAVLISSLQGRRRTAEALLRLEREGLEKRVVERTAELLNSQQQLKQLVNDVVTVAEREQQRIGRDLHDGLGQELTGISLFSSALADRLQADQSPASAQAEQVAALARQSILYTRNLARGLCPVDLEDEGLHSALSRLAEGISRLPNIVCLFEGEPIPALDADTSIHLYRIAQEATNNAIRHGKARTIRISLRSLNEQWELAIADDGSGFDPHCGSTGMGLRLMRHRATTIGAALDIQSDARGVCVTCRGENS